MSLPSFRICVLMPVSERFTAVEYLTSLSASLDDFNRLGQVYVFPVVRYRLFYNHDHEHPGCLGERRSVPCAVPTCVSRRPGRGQERRAVQPIRACIIITCMRRVGFVLGEYILIWEIRHRHLGCRWWWVGWGSRGWQNFSANVTFSPRTHRPVYDNNNIVGVLLVCVFFGCVCAHTSVCTRRTVRQMGASAGVARDRVCALHYIKQFHTGCVRVKFFFKLFFPNLYDVF